jgi:hypothetical protein
MKRSKEFYLQLLTSQYQDSPKLKAALELMVTRLDEVDSCMDLMDYSFDLDYAVGVQLDILGEVVGIKRILPFQPTYGLSPILVDEDYRILLKATIGKNHWDGIQGTLSDLWAVLFPDAILATHDNNIYGRMDMDIFINFPNRSSIFIDLALRGYIVPTPECVKVKYYLGPPFPLFGCDFDDPYVSGAGIVYDHEEGKDHTMIPDIGGWVWSPGYNQYPYFGTDQDDEMISGADRGRAYNSTF